MSGCLQVLVILWLAAGGSGPPAEPKTIFDSPHRFAFDCPVGCRVDSLGDSDYMVCWQKAGCLFRVAVDWSSCLPQPMSDPADTLLSFVKENFGAWCDAGGTEGEVRAQGIHTIRRHRTPRGSKVIEFTVDAVREYWDGNSDDTDTTSTAPTDSTADTLEVTTTKFVGGPFFVVDLSLPGRLLFVWVETFCEERTEPDAVRLARVVANSLRRF
jgi:hypothetical protein